MSDKAYEQLEIEQESKQNFTRVGISFVILLPQ